MSQEPRKFKIFDAKKKEFKSTINSDCFYINRNGVLYYEVLDCETGKSEIEEARKDLIPIYSTGLKDRNKKEIFDRDRVKIDYNYLGVITVNYQDGKWNIADYTLSKVEILGSSLINHELLEK